MAGDMAGDMAALLFAIVIALSGLRKLCVLPARPRQLYRNMTQNTLAKVPHLARACVPGKAPFPALGGTSRRLSYVAM